MRRGKRTGVTIVELVVMSAIGAVALGAAYMLFSAGSRQGNRLEEKLRGVQSGQLLLERLSSDLGAALTGPSRPVRVESIGGGKRNRLVFERYDGDRIGNRFNGFLPARRTVYQFDPRTHRVTRDGEPIPLASFASVEFRHQRAQPQGSPPTQLDAVTVVMTTAPPEQLEKGEVDPRSTSTFVETIAVSPPFPPGAARSWVPNYYPLAP